MFFQFTLPLAFIAGAFVNGIHASSCVVFDASWNLYALNIAGVDYSLGTQDNWNNGKVTSLTTTGRPPFTGNNTQCFLSQFENAIYILDADASSPTDVYIYNAAKKQWSTQKTNANGVDLTTATAILDHDTNVFFGLSQGVLYQADFAQLTDAQTSSIDWQNVGKPSFTTTNYSPVMALAQNHIHFLDVPGASAGQAYIFVIHFAFFQPTPQSYPATSGNAFPATHGQATSFFMDSNVQQQFAFIPDDGSSTFVINVETNTTTPLAGPTDKTSGAVYAASTAALVQLTSSGKLYYLPYNQKSPSTSAVWTTINVLGNSGVSPGSSTSSSPSSSTGISTKTTSVKGSATSTSSSTASSATGTGGATFNSAGIGASLGSALAVVAAFFAM